MATLRGDKHTLFNGGDRAVADQDLPRSWTFKSGKTAQTSGLAAAAWANEHEHFRGGHLERKSFQCHNAAESLTQIFDKNGSATRCGLAYALCNVGWRRAHCAHSAHDAADYPFHFSVRCEFFLFDQLAEARRDEVHVPLASSFPERRDFGFEWTVGSALQGARPVDQMAAAAYALGADNLPTNTNHPAACLECAVRHS